jgi:hypothetical protein
VASLSGSDKATATTNANSGRDKTTSQRRRSTGPGACASTASTCPTRRSPRRVSPPRARPAGTPRSSGRRSRPASERSLLPTVARSAAAAVRLGVRSRRPAGQAWVSVLDGGPGGCPSRCPAVGLGASILTACRAGKVQENRMSGAGDRRGGA